MEHSTSFHHKKLSPYSLNFGSLILLKGFCQSYLWRSQPLIAFQMIDFVIKRNLNLKYLYKLAFGFSYYLWELRMHCWFSATRLVISANNKKKVEAANWLCSIMMNLIKKAVTNHHILSCYEPRDVDPQRMPFIGRLWQKQHEITAESLFFIWRNHFSTRIYGCSYIWDPFLFRERSEMFPALCHNSTQSLMLISNF